MRRVCLATTILITADVSRLLGSQIMVHGSRRSHSFGTCSFDEFDLRHESSQVTCLSIQQRSFHVCTRYCILWRYLYLLINELYRTSGCAYGFPMNLAFSELTGKAQTSLDRRFQLKWLAVRLAGWICTAHQPPKLSYCSKKFRHTHCWSPVEQERR